MGLIRSTWSLFNRPVNARWEAMRSVLLGVDLQLAEATNGTAECQGGSAAVLRGPLRN